MERLIVCSDMYVNTSLCPKYIENREEGGKGNWQIQYKHVQTTLSHKINHGSILQQHNTQKANNYAYTNQLKKQIQVEFKYSIEIHSS